MTTETFLQRAGRRMRGPHREQPADLLAVLSGTARVRSALEADRVILPPVPALQDLCRRAAEAAGTGAGVMTVLTATDAVVKACWGDRQVVAGERFPAAYAYCAYVVRDDAPLVLPDTSASPAVRACLSIEDVGAYTGAPIRSRGVPIGSLAGYAVRPQPFRDGHAERLVALAHEATRLIADFTAAAP